MAKKLLYLPLHRYRNFLKLVSNIKLYAVNSEQIIEPHPSYNFLAKGEK